MATPKYEVIKQDIIRMIEENEFKPGDKIYSEGELKKKYQVSNTTAVRALQDLVQGGYLIRRQGEGTFVRRNFKHRQVFVNESGPLGKLDVQALGEIVEQTQTEIVTHVKDEKIAVLLKVSPTEEMIKITQIASVNDTIWKVQERFVVASKLKSDALERLAKGSSLSKELNTNVNLSALPMKMTVNIQNLHNNSDEEMIKHWRTQMEASEVETLALFVVDKLTFDSEGKPLEYGKSLIHPDYYAIEMQTGDNL